MAALQGQQLPLPQAMLMMQIFLPQAHQQARLQQLTAAAAAAVVQQQLLVVCGPG
jgi:hypothetical protein